MSPGAGEYGQAANGRFQNSIDGSPDRHMLGNGQLYGNNKDLGRGNRMKELTTNGGV